MYDNWQFASYTWYTSVLIYACSGSVTTSYVVSLYSMMKMLLRYRQQQ